MSNSIFRTRIFEAQNHILELFVQSSHYLTSRQRARILKKIGGAA
ncbi:hypothetical protein [Providencia rettgeri]|uniref:Uncharacterized protein n=1 Tax=Providencia rettgeri TaxID=587 RepID=A0A379FTM1_PRORE|nr:Uncharacterised protein [Providencia rettgeri]